jgi:hypothetical protein
MLGFVLPATAAAEVKVDWSEYGSKGQRPPLRSSRSALTAEAPPAEQPAEQAQAKQAPAPAKAKNSKPTKARAKPKRRRK